MSQLRILADPARWTARSGLCILCLTLALLSSCITGCGEPDAREARGAGPPGGPGAGPPPLPVQAAAAALRTSAIEIPLTGSLRSAETAVLAADASGVLVSLNAPEGRPVARGRLLARLDDSEARAAVKVAQARLDNARAVLERTAPLFEDGVVSRQMLDDAQAELDTATGLLDEAKTRLAKTSLHAPFAGVVGISDTQVGQYLARGDPIVTLTRVDPLELLFAVPEDQASLLSLGLPVRGRVGRCGEAFEGEIAAIDPALDRSSRTLQAIADVPNESGTLRPGMSARLALVLDQESQQLVVPREALVPQGTGYRVWVVADDNSVEARPVTAGRFHSDVVEITDGLREGERVVAAGWQKIRPGGRVTPTPWQPTNNPNLELGGPGGVTGGADCPPVSSSSAEPASNSSTPA